MSAIEVKNLVKKFHGQTVLHGIDLEVKPGEVVAIIGPSGSGKTTLLRSINLLEQPEAGTITVGDITIDTARSLSQQKSLIRQLRQHVGFVFQNFNLFPHRTVLENIIEGPVIVKGEPKEEATARARELLAKVGLAGKETSYPRRLSGGQQQRVAIARALVNEPEVLLLDEPLGALDLKMRKDMQIELMNMHRQLGITFIYVTHDQEEALTMSDTIVVMKDGVIQQIANPQKIYDEPANAFVADFIGESNILSGTFIKDCLVDVLGHQLACVDKGFKKKEPVDVIIRPEDIELLPEDDEKAYLFAKVTSCVFKGDHFQTTVETDDEEKNELLIHNNFASGVNQRVGVYVKPFDLHIMHKNRIINELVTVMWDSNAVEICGGRFPCNADLPAGTRVKVKIDFDDVIVHDDEEDGIIGGTVVNSIYKGSYYQCIIRTDDYYDFFVDTDDDWLKGDRVGLSVAPEKLIVEIMPEEADGND